MQPRPRRTLKTDGFCKATKHKALKYKCFIPPPIDHTLNVNDLAENRHIVVTELKQLREHKPLTENSPAKSQVVIVEA